eukprot:CFRG2109T1
MKTFSQTRIQSNTRTKDIALNYDVDSSSIDEITNERIDAYEKRDTVAEVLSDTATRHEESNVKESGVDVRYTKEGHKPEAEYEGRNIPQSTGKIISTHELKGKTKVQVESNEDLDFMSSITSVQPSKKHNKDEGMRDKLGIYDSTSRLNTTTVDIPQVKTTTEHHSTCTDILAKLSKNKYSVLSSLDKWDYCEGVTITLNKMLGLIYTSGKEGHLRVSQKTKVHIP